MRTEIPQRRVRTFNGERVLLPAALTLLLLSALLPISVAQHWPRFCKALGVYGLFLSPAFLMLSCWEIWRYQHKWRTLLASVILLLATAVGWGALALRIVGKL
jgi:hypothetical protein